jgi:hypothetical protein
LTPQELSCVEYRTSKTKQVKMVTAMAVTWTAAAAKPTNRVWTSYARYYFHRYGNHKMLLAPALA